MLLCFKRNILPINLMMSNFPFKQNGEKPCLVWEAFWLVGPVKACVWGVEQGELTWVLTFPFAGKQVPCGDHSACNYLGFVVFRFCAVVCFERISEKLGSEKCGACTHGPGRKNTVK